MAISDEALAAMDVLETYGWIQRKRGDTRSGFCLLGAAMFRGAYLHDLFPVILGRELEPNSRTGWNDHPDRTIEDVFELLGTVYFKDKMGMYA